MKGPNMCDQRKKTIFILSGRNSASQILCRLVGPADGGDHPAQWKLASGGSSASEDASNA